MVSTHLKNMIVKLEIFPNFRGDHKKNIWNHHLDAPLGFLKLKKNTHHFPDRSEKVGKSPFWARRLTADKPPPNNIGRSDSSLFAWKKFPTKIWTANPFWVVSTTPPKTNSWNLTKSPLSTGKSSSKLVFFGSMLVFFLKTCHESNHQEIHGLHPSLASDHPLREIIAKSHECKRAAPLVLATSPFFRKTHRTKKNPAWMARCFSELMTLICFRIFSDAF